MSVEGGDPRDAVNQQAEAGEWLKKPIISYSREFLLSLSELDVCKKLPDGFDQSILCEFEDAPQDRFRSSGGLSSQSYRRSEYSSSPPTRGDISNYSKGNQGRWDSRSSGKSDRDSDAQSDMDSDVGRHYGNQSRRPWQVPEHDGLLGSGAFPRPSGYAAGASAPKFRSNDHYQLSRSNEPYHPPRPYKAVPHSRDAYNDETFGSSECTSEDRAEEERKRRASFELMRKEQHKAFQEKHKLNPEKGKDEFDISELLDDPKDDKRFLDRRNESDEAVTKPTSNFDSNKSSFPTSASVSRPLVPPGFSSPIVEKNMGTKSITHSQASEVGDEQNYSILLVKGNHGLSGTSNNLDDKSLEQIDKDQQLGSPSIVSVDKQSDKIPILSSTLDILSDEVGNSQCYKTSRLSETFDASKSSDAMGLEPNNLTKHKVAGGSSSSHSTSILDKLFGSALTLNGTGSSGFTEQNDVKAEDVQDFHVTGSSRFAQWFVEEEGKPIGDVSSSTPEKPVNNLSSSKPSDLLSLIVGGGNSVSQAFGVDNSEGTPSFPFQGAGLADELMTSNFSLPTTQNIDKLEAPPAVLTCEDLEQSILSDINENSQMFEQPVEGLSGGSIAKKERQKVDIDDHASQHLLSLLKKGTDLSTDLGSSSLDKLQNIDTENLDPSLLSTREVAAENKQNSDRPLTLETLFGTAFMKELQSAGTPSSFPEGLVGSMRIDASEPILCSMDKDLPSYDSDNASSILRHGNGPLALNQGLQLKPQRTEETILGYDPQNAASSSQFQTELGSKLGGADGTVEIQLPEEDSLIVASDPLNLQNFTPARNSAKAELLSTPETVIDIAEKLAAMKSIYRDERPTGVQERPFFRGSYDMSEADVQYRKTHVQPFSQQLHPQLNNQGQFFHQLDSHPANVGGQMKFLAPESTMHHDHPNNQFPSNLLPRPFHHPSTGFDPSQCNPMLQQMQSPGDFQPPSHVVRGFPRGGPLPSHPNNQLTGFAQEPNSMQGFPYGQRLPNFGGLGIPSQAPDAGGGTHHPEALQRLIEMELRSKAKPIHPVAANQGMHGRELDTGFGFR